MAGIEVSVLLSEAHTINAQATKVALESGAQVSDHIILEPYVINVTFEVSNAGLWHASSKDVFDMFKSMLEKRELFELITEHYTYDNIALINFSPTHSAPYKGRIQCTASFQRINQVKLETVGREEKSLAGSSGTTKDTTNKTASPEVGAGTQRTTEPSRTLLQQAAEKFSEWWTGGSS